MDRTPIPPQSDQWSSDRRPSERKNMEESPSYRRRHRVQSRLNDRAKMTSELAADEGSEDEEPTNIVLSLSRPSRHKDRSCSRDRRQMRTSSEDLPRRHRKKTGSPRVQIQAPSDDSSLSAEDYVDTTKPTHWMKPPKYYLMEQRPLKHSMVSFSTAPSTISGQRLISSLISKEHYRRKPAKSYGTTDRR